MKDIKNFPISVTIEIAWGDMDAFGHVNNIVFFRFFETARIRYFEEIGLTAYMKQTGIGPILAETSCKFKKPLFYPETIKVCTAVSQINESGFIMDYKIIDSFGETAALGEARIVIFDYSSSKKIDMPEQIRTAIESLEKTNSE